MTAWLPSLSLRNLQTLNSWLSLGGAAFGIFAGVCGLASWRVGIHITARQEAQSLDVQVKLEQNRIVVNRHLKDRDLLDSQGKILAAIVAPLKGERLSVSVVPHDPEAARFADKIRKVLADSGVLISAAGQMPVWTHIPTGFGLTVGIGRQKDAAILREGLAKSGLEADHIQTKPTGETMELELFIGPKG